MRSDALGLFWRDEPPKPKEKAEKVRVTPPERTWENPDYLPYLNEALTADFNLMDDEELVLAQRGGHRLIYDTEIYPNYFLAAFQDIFTKKRIIFELFPDDDILFDTRKLEWVMKNFLTVGFNSMSFDNTVMSAVLAGCDTLELYHIVDDMIGSQLRPADVLKARRIKPVQFNHIDLIEVAPLSASLKIYGGRCHTKRMQDLPFKPGTFLSVPQSRIVRFYCCNDLQNTQDLYNSLTDELELREEMTAEYGIDLRSKSDAQIAEAVIAKEIQQITGKRPSRPTIEPGTTYKYNIPFFLKFTTPILQNVLEIVRSANFVVGMDGAIQLPAELKDLMIPIGYQNYRMGIGGLHSSEKCQAVRANELYLIKDIDVTSFYPYIILNQGLTPSHLGAPFLRVYATIVDSRVKAKAMGKHAPDKVTAKRFKKKSNSLKIVINGSYGKLSSMWSVLYAPQLQIQTTLSGQLVLLMLIERLELAGFHIVSANTDGIVIYCRRDRETELNSIVAAWEKETHFETEATQYNAIFSRDVNNYIAVYTEPKDDEYTKTKGAYSKAGLSRNPTNEICIDAIEQLLVFGTPIEKTIHECKDIRKFITVRRVSGGAVKNGEYLGGAIRWYYAREQEGTIIYAKSGNKVPKTEGAKPLMTLPDEFPQDIDYDWYIREAQSMLADIGYL